MSEHSGQTSDQHQAPFVHLHVHSEYSMVDGAIRVGDLLKKVKDLGHHAVAVTDHGNLFGAVEFYSKAQDQGIKPIIGSELYFQPSAAAQSFWEAHPTDEPPLGFKSVLLARTNIGYKNLVKLVSAGHLSDLSPNLPVVPNEKFAALGKEQVFLASCHGSEFSYLVQQVRQLHRGEAIAWDAPDSEAKPAVAALTQYVELLRSNVDQDHIYVELVRHNFPGEESFLRDLAGAAHHFGLPLVATANAHYLSSDDQMAHTILLGIKNDLKLGQLKNRRQNVRAHVCSNDEMLEAFQQWPEALANTLTIADACNVSFTFGKFYLPKISLSADAAETTAETMARLAKEGLQQRLNHLEKVYGPQFTKEAQQEYWTRLDYEIRVINDMGFPDYFLIVQDFINWAKEHDIPVGPGRGSGAGSIVAYALRITDLDPIPYNLIFERFLNPERVSMPDFDVDFCQDRRDEVIQYVTEKYGKDQVAQITTFGKMLAKAVVRDVGRVLDMSYGKVDRIAKLIPNELGIKLQDALDREPRIHEEANRDPMIKDLLEYALKLEGLSRHTSVHAAGIVISDGPMEDYVPVYRSDDGSLITQFEMKNAEKVGLVKFDFLGLKTLTVIQRAIRIIKKTTGKELDITAIPMNDKQVFDLISAAKSIGVFQLESTGMQQLLTKLQPSTFEDVIALVALFRPGPLGSGMVDDFVERKHGRQEIEYLLPQLEPILKDTYGTILYQEQVQKIAAVLASYSLGEADLLRRAMGKKKPEEMEKQKSRFIDGCKQNNISEEIATTLFDMMAKFAEYGFNKSHSAAYGLVSYQTAYLKTHFPAEFMAAIMTCDMDNTDKIVRYVLDCKQLGIKVSPPDLNESELDFTVPAAKQVRFGMAAIKGIGRGSLETLVEERRANGPFKTLTDLANRVDLHKVGKKTLELLIQAGAMDQFGYHRRSLMAAVADLVRFSQNHHHNKSRGQALLFDDVSDEKEENDQFSDLDTKTMLTDEPANEWLTREKKLLGVYLSSHPLKLFEQDRDRFANANLAELPKLAGQSEIFCVVLLVDHFERTTREGKKMMVIRLEDETDMISPAMFEGDYPETMPPLETPLVCKFRVTKGFENFPPRVRLEQFFTLEEFRRAKIKQAELRLKVEEDTETPDAVIQRIKKLLADQRGNTKIRLVLQYQEAEVVLSGNQLRTTLTNDLFQRVTQMRSCGLPSAISYL